MALKYANNAKTTLNGAITDVATSIVVVDGSVFPTLGGSDYFYMTLEDVSLNREIVKVTARSTNTLTVVRAQNGTTARAFSNADKAEGRLVTGILDDLAALVGGVTPSAFFLTLVDDTTAGAFMTTLGISSDAQAFITAANNGAMRTALGLGTAALVADNTLVHLAGAETITGAKTISTGGAADSVDFTIGNSQSIMKFSGGDGSYAYMDSASWGIGIKTAGTYRLRISNGGVVTADGTWTFSSQITATAAIGLQINNTQPRLDMYESDGGSNAKLWSWIADGGVLYLQLRSDADVFGSSVFTATRTAQTATTLAFPSTTTTTFAGSGTVSGAWTFSGANVFSGSVYPIRVGDGGYIRHYNGSTGVDWAFGKPDADQWILYRNGTPWWRFDASGNAYLGGTANFNLSGAVITSASTAAIFKADILWRDSTFASARWAIGRSVGETSDHFNFYSYSTASIILKLVYTTGQALFGGVAGQSNAKIVARATTNNIEFGHTNTAGYGSALGAEAGSGAPFLAFNGEHGTNSNTYQSRGIKSSIFKSDNAGGFYWGTVGSTTADNQSFSSRMYLDVNGALTVTRPSGIGSITMVTSNGGGNYGAYLQFTDGSNTQSIRSVASGQLRIAINGTETIFFDANGMFFQSYKYLSFPSGNAYGLITGRYNLDGGAHDDFWITDNYNPAAATIDNTALGTAGVRVRATNAGGGEVSFWTGAVNTAPSKIVLVNNSGMEYVTVPGPASVNAIGLRGLGGVADKGTSYTFALTDAGRSVNINDSGSNSFTVPPASSVAFPAGTVLCGTNHGSGTLTIARGSGVTFRDGSGTDANLTVPQWSRYYLERSYAAADTWYVRVG